jgi:hypothetical protein
VPLEGREEERERRWSEHELDGSVHGSTGENRSNEPHLRKQGVADACSEERGRWRSTMRGQLDGGGSLVSERSGGGDGELRREVLPLGFSKWKEGASELGSGMEVGRGHGDLRWSARGPQGTTWPTASACGCHAAGAVYRGCQRARASGRERRRGVG